MSGPMKLNASQLTRLSEFLRGLTMLRHETGVRPDAYAALDVGIDDGMATVRVSWDDSTSEYIVDDRNGS